MVPKKYQKVYDAIDENKDGVISEAEIEKALETLNKAQKSKALDHHKNAMMIFNSTVLK
jgi:Ca2+-binding EF-hand superfamily protein